MTTRPTDEEIRVIVDRLMALRPVASAAAEDAIIDASRTLLALLAERQTARDGMTDEMASKVLLSLPNFVRYNHNESEWAEDVSAMRAALQSIAQPVSEIVVTKNEVGQIVAVTRQDEDGRVLEVIAESTAQPVKVPDAYTVPAVSKTVTLCSCGKSWEAGSAPDCACRNTSTQPQQAVPDGWKLVPVEPTMEMIRKGKLYHGSLLREQWKGMLSAAPAYNSKKDET